jgi:hypothetical protein
MPSENLPAVAAFSTGVASMPLTDAPTAALAFALGYAVARPVDANAFGPFCAMVEELMRRDSGSDDRGPVGGWDQTNVFGMLLGLLPEAQARAIVMLYQAQRGQRWHRTGQYRHGRETDGRPGGAR